MSSHHCAAGTRQWKRSVWSSGRSSWIASVSSVAQSGQAVSTRPSEWSAAQMPIASHAQLPYQLRPPASTRYGVGATENGGTQGGFDLSEIAGDGGLKLHLHGRHTEHWARAEGELNRRSGTDRRTSAVRVRHEDLRTGIDRRLGAY